MTSNAGPAHAFFATCDEQTAQASSKSKTATTPTSTTSGRRFDPVRVARWRGQIEGDLRPGGEFRLYLEADDIDSTGRVDACKPPRRLVVTTRETDESYRKGQGVPPFDAVKELTLTPDGDETVLVLEVQGMPLDAIAFYGAAGIPRRKPRRVPRWP